jgi:hypothetical protein
VVVGVLGPGTRKFWARLFIRASGLLSALRRKDDSELNTRPVRTFMRCCIRTDAWAASAGFAARPGPAGRGPRSFICIAGNDSLQLLS